MNQPSTRLQIQQMMKAEDFSSAFALAEKAISQINTADTDDLVVKKRDKVEMLYLAACCARYLNQTALAHARLADILAIEPFFGRAFLEQGHLYRAEGKAREALSCYQRAAEANPALVAAWRNQVTILKANEVTDLLKRAQMQLEYHEALPPPILRAKHYLFEGRLAKAEALCKSFMQENPLHVDGMRLLAEIFTRLGANEEAEQLLAAAINLRPDDSNLRIDYLLILRKQQKFAQSNALCDELLATAPNNRAFRFQKAVEDMQAGNTEAARASTQAMIADEPNNAGLHVLLGHLNKASGDDKLAAKSYQRAIALQIDSGDAFYALANLKTHTFSRDEMITMQGLLDENRCTINDRIHLHFALASGHEAAQDYDAAFAHYKAGNDAKRAQSRYTSDTMHAELQRQQTICTHTLFEAQAGKGHNAPDPIFIVGLPRAGSTLIEQILASHSQIDGTLELPNILSLAHKLRGDQKDTQGSAYPQVLHDLSADELRDMGEQFIEATKLHRQGAAFFTDKMPNNFRHIGLIHLILPNAKIIDARRNPMDCCFSGYKQLFAQGQEFTYGLEEIGRYYTDYVALMDHWHKVLPDNILHVQHEDVLDDLEGQVRLMLDYLGLDFEPACLEFYKTERDVRTASASQVRQPINRKGVDAWRPFDAHLQPLKDALGAHYASPSPRSQKASHHV